MTEKSFKEIAVLKKLPIPDEESGLVLHEHVGVLKSMENPTSMDSMWPTADELNVINRKALVPQRADKWIVIRNVNPLGVAKEIDIQGDEFMDSAVDDLVSQGLYTPICTDHDHSLSNRMPVGMSIAERRTPDGLREDYAIPIEEYNADLRAAMMNGTVNQLSVGTLVYPQDKICSSCNKSIYSYACGHEPNQFDERGNRVTVKIKHVARYLERSLTNVPVRLSTSLKSLDSILKGTVIDFELPPFVKNHFEFKVLNALIKSPELYKKLPVLQSRTDQVISTQSSIDPEKVSQMAKDGNFHGGLTLTRDQKTYMIDGHHRLEAAKSKGQPTIWSYNLALSDQPMLSLDEVSQALNVENSTLEDAMKAIKFKTEEPKPEPGSENPQTLAPPSYMADPEEGGRTDKITNLGQAITEEPYFPMHGENIDPLTPEEQKMGKNLTAATINPVNTIEDSKVSEKTEKGMANTDPRYQKDAVESAPSAGTTEQELKATVDEGAHPEAPKQPSESIDTDKGKKKEDGAEEDDCMKAKPPAEAKDDAKDPEKVGKKYPTDRGAGGDDQDNDADTHKSLTPIKVEAHIGEDSLLSVKALVASNKAQAEQVTKMLEAVAAQKAQVDKQLEALVEQSKNIDKLGELMIEVAKTIKAAAEVSSDELIEKMAYFKKETQEVTTASNKALNSFSDSLPNLFSISK